VCVCIGDSVGSSYEPSPKKGKRTGSDVPSDTAVRGISNCQAQLAGLNSAVYRNKTLLLFLTAQLYPALFI
jgi:hypothetical protein